jgi:hypothetical protein
LQDHQGCIEEVSHGCKNIEKDYFVPPDIDKKTVFTKPVNTEVEESSGSWSDAVKAPWLPHPVRITEQVWPEGAVPVVSVFCITYNHEKFIRDAIEGFLMQETTFPVEIFIHDDASTDGTAQIVKEYAEKYPQLFWTVLQTENQWAKGNTKILFEYLSKQRGQFIAMCEGDDFWTLAKKLYIQVEYLRNNPACSCTFHLASTADEAGKQTQACSYIPDNNSFTLIECFTHLGKQYATSSMVFRRAALSNAPKWLMQSCNDAFLELQLARYGNIDFINLNMSSYRIHPHGIWSRLNDARRLEEQLKRYNTLLTAEWIPSPLVHAKIHECRAALWHLKNPRLGRLLLRLRNLLARVSRNWAN